MNGNRMLNEQVRLFGFVTVLAWSATAHGQAWVSFVEDPSRISADPSVINDLPCNPNCTGECGPVSPGPECENVCACACEKDMAVGDLDGDGDDDLIIVRIQPFETQGGVSNLLFLNENETMVDRSNLAEGFADLTQDRDVVIKDINDDQNPDVITATTYAEQPRVYMNLGCCNTACSPSSPCTPANQVPCNDPKSPCTNMHRFISASTTMTYELELVRAVLLRVRVVHRNHAISGTFPLSDAESRTVI